MNDFITNRSDIVVLFDAKNCNPNGNPLSPNNEPRRDSVTGKAEVTSGRIKRYLRDQMYEDGNQILVLKPSQYDADKTLNLDELWTLIQQEHPEVYTDEDDDNQEVNLDMVKDVLMDVRFFGSVFAEIKDINAMRGAIQFQIGQTLHRTRINDETRSITGVASTGDSDEGGDGGAMGTDVRLRYGLFAVNGSINEQVGQNNRVTLNDIKYFDKLVWKALLTQTHSNSKVGQKPRGYIRVEYNTDGFQIQNLSEYIKMNLTEVDSDEELNSISEYTIDITNLYEVLTEHSEHINKIVVNEDYSATFECNGTEQSISEALSHTDYSVETVNAFESGDT